MAIIEIYLGINKFPTSTMRLARAEPITQVNVGKKIEEHASIFAQAQSVDGPIFDRVTKRHGRWQQKFIGDFARRARLSLVGVRNARRQHRHCTLPPHAIQHTYQKQVSPQASNTTPQMPRPAALRRIGTPPGFGHALATRRREMRREMGTD